MLCIHLKNTDPFFCLAAEEYLLKNFSEDIFMLWQSNDTVVVGKHQNALGEINYRYVKENNITVARRISGGGTVFHDSGNVNFAYMKNVNSPSEISFNEFTKPIIESLAKLKVKAVNSGRNDLLVAGKKISGNAEHVYKNRVLHHGTLLYNSNLENLGNAIKVIRGKYKSKAVQSNRSPVGNIISFLKNTMEIGEFIRFLLDFQLSGEEARYYEITEMDIQNIQQLSEDKFKTWEWNFGYSPKYSFHHHFEINGRGVEVNLQVVKGIISEIILGGNYFSAEIRQKIAQNLTGKQHFFEQVQKELKHILPQVPDNLVYSFF